MKQKIAFIICGQPRFISLYKEYMSKFLFEFDHEIDFFFHFWGTQNNEILDILKPKKFEFENQKDFSDYIQTFNVENKNVSKYRPINNFVSYSYSTKRAFELKDEYEKENDFEYDLVFRIRMDVFILNTLIFKKERLSFYKENFNASDNIKFYPSINHHKLFGLGDLLNFSSSKIMKIFNHVYFDIQKSFNEEEKNYILSSNKKLYCEECWLAYSLYNFMSNNRNIVKGINIFKMPYLLRRDSYYKITQDFEYNFQNTYPPSIII
jgi:hypothetical protein